jgi:hypothetical protein
MEGLDMTFRLEHRIAEVFLFGSDQMMWPRGIERAVMLRAFWG